MKLSEISATLREIGVSPVKTLGQNFLHDQNLARWIVEQAELTPRDYVVEIGPGLGALTELALTKGACVLALEKDTRLANFLRDRFRHPRLEVRNADALDFDVRTLFSQGRVKLMGNLPYNVSSPLLLKFLDYPSPISLSLFTLQKEVASRLSALPSSRDYGALTLRVQLYHRVEYLRTIPATVFVPQPDVDSALVRMSPRDPLELPERDDALFMKLVRRGFSQRRKQLQNLLRAHVPDWERVAAKLGFDPKARAEELSMNQWIGLANEIAPLTVPERRTGEEERFPVVDEMDRILRYAYRSKVHGDNLRHRAVYILIFNDVGEVYLQKRSRRKDRHPLLWDSSAAGHVCAGEGYDEAAQRELQEELGINVPLEKVLTVSASIRTGQEFIWLYRGNFQGDPRPNRSEIEAGAFFTPAVVNGWIAARPGDFAPGFMECWEAYREKKHA
ncbi:MAG: ribosomal RNA small subunit methyltransferase A [Verrucomicrobia bacterium]|nr:MAG: ribosomal RNA small subunit methyltransferase A [Verrucomicrobiota bacterium]